MSNPESRISRSKRLYNDEVKVRKRTKILKQQRAFEYKHPAEKQPHRLHKYSCMNCGNPSCVMCGNPRKFSNERTIQEQSFRQDKLWSEESES